jgi:hypothetical protein
MTLDGILALGESSGSDTISIRSPASIAASYTLTLPTTDGASGEVLTTDGSGVLSWAPAEAATSVSAGAGAVGTPSMSFSTDTNTGFYSSGANQIGIASNGVNTFNFTTTALASPTTGGASITTGNGTAAAPTFSFAGDEDTGWFRAAANELAASTAGSERIRIDSSGNVGIGTTIPEAHLHVAKSSGVSNLFIGDTPNNTTDNLNGVRINAFSDGNNYIDTKTHTGGFTHFRTGEGSETSHQRYWMSVGSSNGNVGIGTTSPSSKLDISQTNGADFALEVNHSGGTVSRHGIKVISSGTSSTSSLLKLESATSSSIMNVGADGNVGIGTSSPQGGLHVQRGVSSGESKFYFQNGTTGASGSTTIGLYPNNVVTRGAEIQALSTTPNITDLIFKTNSASAAPTERMRILSSGNVGIGTTSPTYPLTIKNTSASFAGLALISSASGFLTSFLYEGTANDGELHLKDGSNTTQTKIDSNGVTYFNGGDVGIGTTAPSSELEVNGTIHSTTGGIKYPDNSIQVSAPQMAHITNNGSVCSVSVQSGSWVSSVSRTTTGTCDITVAASSFASTPICTCTALAPTHYYNNCVIMSQSTTNVVVRVSNSGIPGLNDSPFNIICM